MAIEIKEYIGANNVKIVNESNATANNSKTNKNAKKNVSKKTTGKKGGK